MKLVNEIIDILSSQSGDLENALIKAKVLAYKLGEKSMLDWVNAELIGYGDVSVLPEYRMLDLMIFGDLNNGVVRYPGHPLNPNGIPEEYRMKFIQKPVDYGIKAIQELIPKSSTLQVKMPREVFPFLRKGIDRSFGLEDAWGQFSEGAFIQIASEVRTRLLDFMLELDARMPAEPAPEEIKQLSKDFHVDEIFKGAVFGDGATVNFAVGTSNSVTQNINQQSTQNNFAALEKELKQHAVPEKDIKELGEAIESDKGAAEHEKKDFGPKVGGWIAKTIGRAANGTIDLSVKVATGVVVAAITKYYGFK